MICLVFLYEIASFVEEEVFSFYFGFVHGLSIGYFWVRADCTTLGTSVLFSFWAKLWLAVSRRPRIAGINNFVMVRCFSEIRLNRFINIDGERPRQNGFSAGLELWRAQIELLCFFVEGHGLGTWLGGQGLYD